MREFENGDFSQEKFSYEINSIKTKQLMQLKQLFLNKREQFWKGDTLDIQI